MPHRCFVTWRPCVRGEVNLDTAMWILTVPRQALQSFPALK